MDSLLARIPKQAIPLTLLTEEDCASWTKKQPARVRKQLIINDFNAKPGSFVVLLAPNGTIARVIAGISSPPSLWDLGDFSTRLPKGIYCLDWTGPLAFHEWLALGWAMGTYRFTRYKKTSKTLAQLALAPGADLNKIKRYAESIEMARDLINTPAEDMGPAELAAAAAKTGKTYNATLTQIVGDDLLKKNYPAIHTVGRASTRSPRLIDMVWGKATHPRITLVGKGVCFDTGGLDLKNSSGMYLMKKDMGGAACVMAVARMVMDAGLPVRLRVLIPAVENAVAGNAFRPTDVITMRDGTTVEVGKTDAEGRLVLADALVEAASEKPEWLIDFATLTGAARVAVGTELPAFFCTNEAMASSLLQAGLDMEDPLWRLPLHQPYRKMLESPIADLNSAPGSPYAGAILAALFLQHFVPPSQAWAHIDLMAWNLTSKPGRPDGGEAMAVRAVYRLIEQHIKKDV